MANGVLAPNKAAESRAKTMPMRIQSFYRGEPDICHLVRLDAPSIAKHGRNHLRLHIELGAVDQHSDADKAKFREMRGTSARLEGLMELKNRQIQKAILVWLAGE